jgi:hypothetical protein
MTVGFALGQNVAESVFPVCVSARLRADIDRFRGNRLQAFSGLRGRVGGSHFRGWLWIIASSAPAARPVQDPIIF